MLSFLLKVICWAALIIYLGWAVWALWRVIAKPGKMVICLGSEFIPHQTKMLSFQHGFYYASAPAIGLDYKALPILPLSLYHHCLHEGLPG